ncbi:MAG: hypothetical protein N4A33_05800 [Bacteriovoracaceae bacterium]|jgi:sulfur carrier protein ThiS|nr:hypothetical protein [Bacteriovoracaceae bacterium]
MKCDITIDEKNLECNLTFNLGDFTDQKNYKDALTVVSMVSGDYHLDPEIELDDFIELVSKGKSDNKQVITFSINEEEIGAEFF